LRRCFIFCFSSLTVASQRKESVVGGEFLADRKKLLTAGKGPWRVTEEAAWRRRVPHAAAADWVVANIVLRFFFCGWELFRVFRFL
jgi:hypothetical protein